MRWLVERRVRKLLFVGDSTTDQLVSSMECAVQRAGCSVELEHPPSNHASRMTPLSIENRRIAPAPDAWGSVDRKSVFSCLLPGDRRHKRITLQVLQRFHGSTMGAAKAKRCSWWRKDSLRPGSNVSASDAIRFCDEYDDSNDVDSPTQYRKMFDQVDAI
eukprot:6488369-Prymnesium_polylepis.1